MHVAFEEPDGSRQTSSACKPLPEAAELAAAAAPSLAHGQSYTHLVTRFVDKVSADKGEVSQWLENNSPGNSACDHITDVLRAGGITDTASRLRLVGAAARRQQQRLQECPPPQLIIPRSGRHRSRRVVPATTATATPGEHQPDRSATPKKVPAPVSTPTEASPSSDDRTWVQVEGFTTRDEAVSFVLNCQPFEYKPIQGEAPADIEDRAVNPESIEFLSAGGDFKRRLRVRKQDLSEQRSQSCEASNPQRCQATLSPGFRETTGGSGGAHTGQMRRCEPLLLRPWVVEASGALFDRPESLRALRTTRGPAPPRYFVAVAADIEKRVLSEGFRVKRRCSIPCAATPKDALLAWQSVQRTGQAVSVRPSVLMVTLPPDIDVVSNRDGAFRIKARELPAVCFTRCRRPGGGSEML
mmetsp:Transcript_92240/g.183163  ORF Transcript_92240/g.183163 Transcript_92240/m.183163 type:complete len:413 (-) Transcript_92240:118-1356(-)